MCRALQSNGIAYSAPTDINEIWFEHCSNVFEHSTFDETGRAEELTMKVASIRKEANQSKAEDKMTIDLQDIKTICSSLRSGKACGHDKIWYEHLKCGEKLLHKYLCHLFNLCIDLSYVPGDWRRGTIILLYKGDNKPRTDTDSYRGISLVSAIAKVFEKAIDTCLSKIHPLTFLTASKLLTKNAF